EGEALLVPGASSHEVGEDVDHVEGEDEEQPTRSTSSTTDQLQQANYFGSIALERDPIPSRPPIIVGETPSPTVSPKQKPRELPCSRAQSESITIVGYRTNRNNEDVPVLEQMKVGPSSSSTTAKNPAASSSPWSSPSHFTVRHARELLAKKLSEAEGRSVPVSLCFFVHDHESASAAEEHHHEARTSEGNYSTAAETTEVKPSTAPVGVVASASSAPPEPPAFGDVIADDLPLSILPTSSANFVIKYRTDITNIYNALQDAETLEQSREIVYHMTPTELNQSFYRIFRYWGRVGINLLQGCLRGHGPLSWKTSQIQAILEDSRFSRWHEPDAITNRTIFMDVVFYLDNVLAITKLLLTKYEK
ncbi:unnamed protein product, partial [Amoebophrya sp. A25]